MTVNFPDDLSANIRLKNESTKWPRVVCTSTLPDNGRLDQFLVPGLPTSGAVVGVYLSVCGEYRAFSRVSPAQSPQPGQARSQGLARRTWRSAWTSGNQRGPTWTPCRQICAQDNGYHDTNSRCFFLHCGKQTEEVNLGMSAIKRKRGNHSA